MKSLNPLKSGRPVGRRLVRRLETQLFWVSIPSNRGVLSDGAWYEDWKHNCSGSQSPQIGASCRTHWAIEHYRKDRPSLNPLKSGRPVGQIRTCHERILSESLNPLKSGRPVGPWLRGLG